MNRIQTICENIGVGETIHDIGCDHGLVTEYALKTNSFKKAIISDISSKSLEKAKKLLEPYKDRVLSVVGDGFCGLENLSSVAVIAGMGGEETIHILNSTKTLPEKLVLSPQKNVDKVRKVLFLELGYKPQKDFTFLDGKIFYDIIVAVKGKAILTEKELKYGYDNVNYFIEDFVYKIKKEISFYEELLNKEVSLSSRENLEIKIKELKDVLNEN